MNKLLILAVGAIAFFTGASIFNVGFVQGVQQALITGTVQHVRFDEQTTTEPLEQFCVNDKTGAVSYGNQTCNGLPLVVRAEDATWTTHIQPAARAYYAQPTVSNAYLQWGQN